MGWGVNWPKGTRKRGEHGRKASRGSLARLLISFLSRRLDSGRDTAVAPWGRGKKRGGGYYVDAIDDLLLAHINGVSAAQALSNSYYRPSLRSICLSARGAAFVGCRHPFRQSPRAGLARW